MNLLELVLEMKLEPHRTSPCHGGEYHSPCPSCGGRDRFMFWPASNRYWCRQCKASGDAIQFCRDFQGLSYHSAYAKTQQDIPSLNYPPQRFVREPIKIPSYSWESKARSFIAHSHQRLLIDKPAINLILQRGLSIDTITQHQLGWNPVKTFQKRSDWGLEETDTRKWICLPPGIVIPIFESNVPQKLKIRRTDWHEGDPYGKYYEVPGSSNILPIFGNSSLETTVIVEAEFDAMLIIQEAGDLCNSIALGGAQKRPHPTLRQWLLKRKMIFFSLDFDATGKKEYSYWQEFYSNIEPWPVPEEKSPGDYFQKNGSIRNWIINGLKNITKKLYK